MRWSDHLDKTDANGNVYKSWVIVIDESVCKCIQNL